MEKMTYVKALDAAIATLSADQSEVKEKLEALKASIAKKNSAERKPTATQTANEGYKEAILDALEVGKGYTITDLIKGVPALSDLTNQRVSAIVRQMVLHAAQLGGDDADALVDELRRVLCHAVLVLHHVFLVGIVERVEHVVGAKLMPISTLRPADLANVELKRLSSTTSMSFISAGRAVLWV